MNPYAMDLPVTTDAEVLDMLDTVTRNKRVTPPFFFSMEYTIFFNVEIYSMDHSLSWGV
ncbi:hypothetical protein ACS0TY_005826 [Phlomoides rotata]